MMCAMPAIRRGRIGLSLTTLTLIPLDSVQVQPNVEVAMTAAKEIRVVENGKPTVKLVAATATRPDDIIVYTIVYANKGDAPAVDTSLVGPVPKGTVYIPHSAAAHDHRLLFSIGNGLGYREPPITASARRADGTIERKPAPAEADTHVRWVLKRPPPPGAA